MSVSARIDPWREELAAAVRDPLGFVEDLGTADVAELVRRYRLMHDAAHGLVDGTAPFTIPGLPFDAMIDLVWRFLQFRQDCQVEAAKRGLTLHMADGFDGVTLQ